jgi:ppGpp synthetase/RelA/SpoT-type nucleotidyltranferase
MRDGEYKFSKFHERLFYKLWMQTNNAKAVRNRLKVTECLIEKHIRFLYDVFDLREISLLSIASGSARSFLDVFKRIKDLDDLKINMTFLDKSEAALEYSKKIFNVSEFEDEKYDFTWVSGTANGYLNSLEGVHFHLVEMVGLMDYFDDEKVIQTFSSIYETLTKNGCLVTANIIPNSEQKFVTNLIGWRMIYRQPNDFVRLVESAHFEKENIKHIVEPLKVHTIVSAIK